MRSSSFKPEGYSLLMIPVRGIVSNTGTTGLYTPSAGAACAVWAGLSAGLNQFLMRLPHSITGRPAYNTPELSAAETASCGAGSSAAGI